MHDVNNRYLVNLCSVLAQMVKFIGLKCTSI